MTGHTVRAHSEHGASSAYRWMHCPGSVALSRGAPRIETDAAKRGTAAHELAERCLNSGAAAFSSVGETFNGVTVDEGMATAVQIYVDECDTILDRADWYVVEEQFDLTPLDAPVPMFGTCDFAAYVVAERTLYLRDYKNGFHYVPVVGNPQLQYYALGALLALPNGMPLPQYIDVGIVQPNALGYEPVRTHVYAAQEAVRWVHALFSAASATLAPDAPLAAGAWCRYCPASGKCPEQTRAALEAAQVDFADAVASHATLTPVEVRLLTGAQMGALLHKLDTLEEWARQARAAAFAALSADPAAVPGWKIVPPGPGRTVWEDEEAAAVRLGLLHGVAADRLYEPRKLRSPAQLRGEVAGALYDTAKAQGGKLTKKAADAQAADLLRPLTRTPPSSSGPSLAPESDPRPAINGAVEFDNMPALTSK